MNAVDKFGIKDRVEIKVTRNGKVIYDLKPYCDLTWFEKIKAFVGLQAYTTDLIVTTGMVDLATYIKDNYTTMKIGSGSTPAAVSDTAMESEEYSETSSNSLTTTTYTNDTAKLTGTFAITGTVTITEVGIFKSTTMLSRQVFSGLPLVNGDEIVFNVYEQVS